MGACGSTEKRQQELARRAAAEAEEERMRQPVQVALLISDPPINIFNVELPYTARLRGTVQELKTGITHELSFDPKPLPEEWCLIFSDEPAPDEATLEELGVVDGAVLELSTTQARADRLQRVTHTCVMRSRG